MVGEISGRRNVEVGKCPVEEVSVGELFIQGIIQWEKCPSEKCTLGSVSRGLSIYKHVLGNRPVGKRSHSSNFVIFTT